MDFKEYETLSARTESPLWHTDCLNISTIHGIIGIQTESAELLEAFSGTIMCGEEPDLVNIREELGDLLWYLSAVTRSQEWEISSNYPFLAKEVGVSGITLNIQIAAGNLVDTVKKGLFYGVKPDLMTIQINIRVIYHLICNLCELLNWDIRDVMQENIDKLKLRYPEQFTTEHSKNRLDKNEKIE